MDDGFINAYSKTTGKKRRVPKHYIGHPVLGVNLELTPKARSGRPHQEIGGDPVTDTTTTDPDPAMVSDQTPANGEKE